ncbi:hypothetical protein GRI97_15810 [Altererythrobacter xixiisoli]|uniref:Uncharacterized protein n=1 Tax=Croceibacterium xixiisoli TaxID=1476466 RepID=A0A6I4TWP7_9SPHN|nr:hypothetical protein [Croceibacterium xixiisoli]MXP00457.1 hypothetical protein [Croceibacterium xixiisoli]
MAKISDLPNVEADAIVGDEILPIVKDGATATVTLDDVARAPIRELAANVAGEIGRLDEAMGPTIAQSDQLLFVLLDALRQATWLAVDREHGGPPEWVLQFLGALMADKGFTSKPSDLATDLLYAFADAAGNPTWLSAQRSDGGPPPWVVDLIGARLDRAGLIPMRRDTVRDIFASITDEAGNPTWLTAQRSDGGPPPWVIDLLRSRLGIGQSGLILPSDHYLSADGPKPIVTDMTRAALWGSSSSQLGWSYLNPMMASFGVPLFNGGKSNELGWNSFARLGSRVTRLTFPGNTIPASGAVVVGSTMPPRADMLAFAGTIGGVQGTLSSTASEFTFTRSAAGAAVAVPADTPFVPVQGEAHKNAITFIWGAGKNDLTGAAGSDATVIAMHDEAVAYLTPLTKRVIIIGQFVNTLTPAVSAVRDRINAVNDHQRARYGQLFIDYGAYLTGAAVWGHTGLTPTATDLEQQALGNLPPSLQIDNGHVNGTANTAFIKHIVRPRLLALGWFKES